MYIHKFASLCERSKTTKTKTPQNAGQFLSKEPRLVPVMHARILALVSSLHYCARRFTNSALPRPVAWLFKNGIMLILLPSTLNLICNTIIISYQEEVSFFFTFCVFLWVILEERKLILMLLSLG